MTDPSTICPSGWELTGYSKRTCGRNSNTEEVFFTSDSATFPVKSVAGSRPTNGERLLHSSHITPTNGERLLHSSHITPTNGERLLHSSHITPTNGERLLHSSHITPTNGERLLHSSHITHDL